MPRDLERKRNWNRANRNRYDTQDRQAGYPRQAHYRRTHRNEIRDRANERNFRMRETSNGNQLKMWRQGLSIINPGNPPLLYIDAQGRVWQEDFRSAEELITEYERRTKK